MANFMGLEIPTDWVISSDPLSGNFDLAEGSFWRRGLSAIEVQNRIICHHKMEKDRLNEQHRAAPQASRNPTPPQLTAGNAGGAAARGAALAGQGTIAKQYASQGAISRPGGIMPLSSSQMATMQNMAFAQQLAMAKAMMYGGSFEAPQTKPLPRTAPAVGELIGHRAWTVQGGNLLLSISAKSAWFPGQAMLDKIGHGQEIDDHNTAGIWAFKDPYDLANEFWSMLRDGSVFGTVWLWGTVIEHERGYRAQYAAIRSLERASPGIDIEVLRAAYLNRPAHESYATQRG